MRILGPSLLACLCLLLVAAFLAAQEPPPGPGAPAGPGAAPAHSPPAPEPGAPPAGSGPSAQPGRTGFPPGIVGEPGEEEHGGGEEHAERMHLIHKLGRIGAPGVILAGLGGLFIALTHPHPNRRRRLRAVHFLLGGLFGLVAMTHGTLFFFGHLAEGSYDELLASGSWLCTSVFFLVLTGLLRAFSGSRQELWQRGHRFFQVVFLLAVLWHVVPKVL